VNYEPAAIDGPQYSVDELHDIYRQFSCQCDESGLYDQFLVPERAEGFHVWFKGHDEPFLDLGMGFSALNFGHHHPAIREAAEEAIGRIDHVHSFNSESKLLLSKALAEMTPGSPDKKVYFPVGGAMAVETAIKLARAYTGKTRIASFTGAFHGYFYGAMMVTDDGVIDKPQYSPYPGEALRLPYADCYHCSSHANCRLQCLLAAEQRLRQDDDVAALIIEPVQGHAGFVIPPREFLIGLMGLCRERDILFIDDEIQVGMGRTGKFLAIEHSDVEPDIVLLSKSLAGGYYPLSAVIARSDIWDHISPAGSGIGSTFVNSPLGTHIALKALSVLEKEGLLANAGRVGAYFTGRLNSLERFGCIGNVTGLGLTQSFAVVKSKETRQPAPEVAAAIQSEALRQRMIVCRSGVERDRIKFTLPLWVDRDTVDTIVERLHGIVQAAVTAGQTPGRARADTTGKD
jgi:4-aminobutyrate aminotransferase/(S)-3-amino-2-methylpropionate transaminase